MTIRYPGGRKYEPPAVLTNQPSRNDSFSNRGKTLEEELNETNAYYLQHGIAVVHKKPVPIQVVHVKYPTRSAAVITEAYYRTPSTTDYNGVWNGKYIDFEAKETKSTSSLPLQNIHPHQVEHMKLVSAQGGIAFLLVRFSQLNRYFFIHFDTFITKWERMMEGGRKSIPLHEFEAEAIEIIEGYSPRIDYIEALRIAIKEKE